MENSEKQDTRLVQLPSGDWVLPADIRGVRTRYKEDHGCGIVTKPHVTVIVDSCGHINIPAENDDGVRAMADRIATIANTTSGAARTKPKMEAEPDTEQAQART